MKQPNIKKMTPARFSDEMSAKGCTMLKNTACGVYNDMPYKLFLFGVQMNFSVSFSQKISKQFLKTVIKTLKPEMKAINRTVTPNVFTLELRIKDNTMFSQKIDFLLETVDREARNAGYTTAVVCAICNQPNPDSYALYNSNYTAVHANCMQQKAETKIAKAQKNALNGNYVTGFLGAVIGGAVGLIPNILVAVLFNYIIAWLCALVPLCAYFGYKLLQGKMNYAAPIFSILVSIVSIPVMDYAHTAISVFQNFDEYRLPPSEYIELLRDYPADFLPAIGQIALFIGLGVVIVSGLIIQGNKQVHNDAAEELSSIRPIHPEAASNPTAPVMPSMERSAMPVGDLNTPQNFDTPQE